MNLFKEQGVKDYAAAASQIPVIDFGAVFAGEPGAVQALAPAGTGRLRECRLFLRLRIMACRKR